MKTKAVLELADVKAVLNAAEAEAVKNQWIVSIAVVDDGGNLLGMIRRDGAAPCRPTSAWPRPAPRHWAAARARVLKT